MAFAQRETAATDKRGYFEPDALDDRTWMLATPAVRQGYIEKRRREDAEAARVLVEAVWTSENADIRVRLLSALREGLSAGDAKFLQGLDKDRAPRVRELALRLLARLPGGSGDHPALRAAVKRIRKGQSGFFRKQTTLALELPATVKPPAAPGWIHETFGELSLDELARALNLSISDMVEAATKDEHLLLAFAIIATRDKAFTVLEGLVAALPQAWELMAQAGLNDLDGLTDDERRRWAALILRSAEWDAGQSLWVLVRLHQLLRTTVSEVMMGALLKSRPWQFVLKDNARLTPDTVELMAALCPPSRRGALRTQLAGLDPAKTGHALNFLEL
ncbi:MAG: hypothetical protein JF615_17355, partial [Asticcacaulis sp.]|nr:hypothetical protein [Asticcacaulis sp.]